VKYPFLRLCLACLLLVILSGAAFISWSLIKATTSYRKGNYPAATAVWQRLSPLFPGSSGIAFNNGVTLYRQREYRKAAELFSRSSACSDPLLKAAARYNLGNCLVRQGDELVAGDTAGDRAVAADLYGKAIVQYEQAVQLDSTDPDAPFNLAAARNRLQTVRATLQEQPGKNPGPGTRQQKESRSAESRQAPGKTAPENRDASEAKQASSGDQVRDKSSAKVTQDGQKNRSAAKALRMTRKDAEALLREHLKTDGATAVFRDANKPGHPADVLKDW
jgi:tetratricopeptide (TPR) repeat protein